MKIFGANYLIKLIVEIQGNPRNRHHDNIYESYEDICQRLFSAFDVGSYIRLR